MSPADLNTVLKKTPEFKHYRIPLLEYSSRYNHKIGCAILIPDVACLRKDEFITCNIVFFYLLHLWNTLLDDSNRNQYFFFDSAFGQKILEASDEKAAWASVQKIIPSDFCAVRFIFLPLCWNEHWRLIIVCRNPPSKCCFADTDTLCLMYLDSKGGKLPSIEIGKIRGIFRRIWPTAPTVECYNVCVPNQGITNDCALFMLHSVELFLSSLLKQSPSHLELLSENFGLSGDDVSLLQYFWADGNSRNWYDPVDVTKEKRMKIFDTLKGLICSS